MPRDDDPRPTPEVDALRRRAKQISVDMTDLVAALGLDLGALEDAPLDDDAREAAQSAAESVAAFSQSLHVVQALLQAEPFHVAANAAGWIRVGVSCARAEGRRVLVDGTQTALRVEGQTTEIARVIEDLLVAIPASDGQAIRLQFVDEGIDLRGPDGSAHADDGRLAAALARVSDIGWSAHRAIEDGRSVVRVRSAAST